MGMYTAVGRTDEWMAKFGIDVEEIDQWEIVRRSELMPASRGGCPGSRGFSGDGPRGFQATS